MRTPALLSPFLKELATCAVAFLNDAEFEIVRHGPALLREGGSKAQLDALRDVQAAVGNAQLFDASHRAVLSLCYEMTRGGELSSTAPRREPAVGELIQALNSRARQLLLDVDFFGGKNPDRMCAELQSLAGRTQLSTREASMLLSFIAHVEKALRQAK